MLAATLALLAGHPLHAQEGTLQSHCEAAEIQALGAGDACFATAQAATSAQPVVGILIGGGNPTLGSAGAAGLRLNLLPRLSAGLRLNVVPVRLPDILARHIPGQAGSLTRRLGMVAPALAGDVSLGLTDGFRVAPTLGGIGGISLLGSATYLPFALFGAEGFDGADIAYGLGARMHLLDESFAVPGISLSIMRKTLPRVSFGDVCPDGTMLVGVAGSEPPRQVSACAGEGDPGEFSFDLSDWSARLVASKRLLGLGGTVGIGHDRYSSDVGLGFRGTNLLPGSGAAPVHRVTDERLAATRWAVFGNLSYTLIIGTLGVEAGWQQGDAPIRGFDELGGDFEPRTGTWFGSVGARLSL